MTNPFIVPPLATAGMNDPRVTAWQPGKFIARLQAASASGEPILLWADYDRGHGIGDTKTKSFETEPDSVRRHLSKANTHDQ